MGVKVRPFIGYTDWGRFIRESPIKQVEDTNGLTFYDDETGETLGIMVCDTWYRDSVNVHIVAFDRRVHSKKTLQECARFWFENPEHPDIKIVYGFIPVDNEKAQKFALQAGFSHVYTLSGGEGGIGFNINTLEKSACKHLTEGA